MEASNVATDNISVNITKENEIESNIVISDDILKQILKQLGKFDTISLCFLFFDKIDVSLKLCQQFSQRNHSYVLMKHLLEEKSSKNWKSKLLECFYHIKHYFILESLGLSKHDAVVAFSKISHVLPRRLNLYEICDSLTKYETVNIMDSVKSLDNEEFLEVFFLKINKPEQWATVYEELRKLNKPIVSLLEKYSVATDCIKSLTKSNEPVVINQVDDSIYPIKDPNNIGLCLIINIMEFQTLESRYGSEKDVDVLKSTFKGLNFTVETVDSNVPSTFFGEQLWRLIQTHFQKNHSIFFMAILSHGIQGHIYCSDEKLVSIDNKILKILAKVNQLQNIPKVLIVQACQGDKYLISRNITTDGLSDPIFSDVSNRQSLLKYMVDDYISDILIAMSTVPGFRSFREKDKGSFFIQKLCNCLNKYPNWSIYDILTETIKHVKSEVVPTKKQNLSVAQQPELKSLLSRRLYLKPTPVIML